MKKKLNYYLSEKNLLVFTLLLSILVLVLPYIVRSFVFNNELMGNLPYFYLLNAEGLKHYTNPILFNPYTYMLFIFSFLVPLKLASKMLPSLFSFFSVFLLYFLLKSFKLNRLTRFLVIFIYVLSPCFISSFTLFPSTSFALFLLFLAFYLFFKKSNTLKFVSLLIFILLPFTSVFAMLFAIFFLFSFLKLKNKEEKNVKTVLYALVLTSFFYYVHLYFSTPYLFSISFFRNPFFQSLISDLGSINGFSTFTIMLAILGFFLSWKNKKKFVYIYFLSFIYLFASRYFISPLIYLNVIVCIMAAFAFTKIIKMRWQLKILRNLTIIILLCGILFSSISYTSRLVRIEPNKEMVSALEFLSNQEEGIVLSHYDYGFWIKYFANKDVLFDSFSIYNKNLYKAFMDINKLYYTNNLEEAKRILSKYNIKYMFIDGTMKQKLWKNQKQGLLLLLTNKDNFKMIYKQGNTAIWEVK